MDAIYLHTKLLVRSQCQQKNVMFYKEHVSSTSNPAWYSSTTWMRSLFDRVSYTLFSSLISDEVIFALNLDSNREMLL